MSQAGEDALQPGLHLASSVEVVQKWQPAQVLLK